MDTLILTVTTLFSGLMAGLFYAWSISVTPGLAKTDNKSYLTAFQSMNRAILNPAFFIAFFGLVFLLLYLTYSFYTSESEQLRFVLSAAVLYLVGIMLVTIFGNIPLNNRLEKLQIESMSEAEMSEFRKSFESKWNRLNTIRTVCSSLSFLLLILACLKV